MFPLYFWLLTGAAPLVAQERMTRFDFRAMPTPAAEKEYGLRVLEELERLERQSKLQKPAKPMKP